MGLLLMTRFTLQEAIRRRLFFAVLILSVLMLGAFSSLLHQAISAIMDNRAPGNQPPSIFLLSFGVSIAILTIWLVYLLSSVLTIVMTVNMISGEIDAGTFAVIMPKPIRRVEIVMGKWLGYALTVGIYTALMFFAFLAVIYWQTGYWPQEAWRALGTLELVMLVLLGITTLGSTCVSTTVNGAIVLVMFIIAPIASIIQFVVRITAPDQGVAIQNMAIVVNLLMPTDALWRGASFYLLPSANLFSALGLSTNSFDTPFTSGTPVPIALLIWVVLYSTVLVGSAVWRFQHRDL